jgi:hypothetical protein
MIRLAVARLTAPQMIEVSAAAKSIVIDRFRNFITCLFCYLLCTVEYDDEIKLKIYIITRGEVVSELALYLIKTAFTNHFTSSDHFC